MLLLRLTRQHQIQLQMQWHPAQKNGVAVASEGVLHIQLPKGKRMPRPVELVWR